jgi:hypothetical protein
MFTEKDKHPDIVLLENKLTKVVGEEEYERAAVLKKWIDLLEEYHEKKNIKKNNKRRTS